MENINYFFEYLGLNLKEVFSVSTLIGILGFLYHLRAADDNDASVF